MPRKPAATTKKVIHVEPVAEIRRYQQVGIHVLPSIAEGLAEIAESRSTNVSQLGRQILTDYVKAHSKAGLEPKA